MEEEMWAVAGEGHSRQDAQLDQWREQCSRPEA